MERINWRSDRDCNTFQGVVAADRSPQYSVGSSELDEIYPRAQVAVERVDHPDDGLCVHLASRREHDVVPSEVVRVAFGAHVVPLLEPGDDLASGLPRHAEHRSEGPIGTRPRRRNRKAAASLRGSRGIRVG